MMSWYTCKRLSHLVPAGNLFSSDVCMSILQSRNINVQYLEKRLCAKLHLVLRFTSAALTVISASCIFDRQVIRLLNRRVVCRERTWIPSPLQTAVQQADTHQNNGEGQSMLSEMRDQNRRFDAVLAWYLARVVEGGGLKIR